MKKGYTIDIKDASVSYFYVPSGSHNQIENCHDRYEIIFALSHLGTITVEGKEYTLDERSLLLISPLSFYNFAPTFDGHLEGYVVSFQKSAVLNQILPMLDKITSLGEYNGRYYY